MSLPPTPWTFTADTYTGEVTLRDATGKPFLTIPASAEMVEAKHAVGLVKRRWRMEGAEALARLLCAAPEALGVCRLFLRAEASDHPDDYMRAALKAHAILASLDMLE